jgi:hypothetical protein
MIINFKGLEEKLIVGNCTPYNGVSASSEEGWDWDFWKNFLVIKVEYIQGNYMTPENVKIIKENYENLDLLKKERGL